jgi:signal transduction histidine kinase
MSAKIFQSNITLKFQNSIFEQKFTENSQNCRTKYNWVFSLILLLISLTSMVFFGLEFNDHDDMVSFQKNKYANIISLVIHVIKLFVAVRYRNNIRVQRALNYYNYLILAIDIALIRFIALLHLKDNSKTFIIYYSAYMLEISFRSCWYVFNMMTFLEGFVSHIVLSLAISIWFVPSYSNPNTIIYLTAYLILLLLQTIFAYIWYKERKNSFYLGLKAEEKSTWYQGIFENMNTSMLRISNGKITYANKIAVKNLYYLVDEIELNIKELAPPTDNDPMRVLSHYSDFLIYKLFINNEFLNEEIGVRDYDIGQKTKDFLQTLKKEFKQTCEESNLLLFKGNSFIVNKKWNPILEIFYRFYYAEDGSESFDFILNDVTRVKLAEEKNADIKYKTLFFSKIAHEFKNPLICISELANQSEEYLNVDSMKLNNNLNIIKALSEFLLILVKDLDHVSVAHLNKVDMLQESYISIDDINQFLSNIVNGLLTKFGKIDKVKFSIDNRLTSGIKIKTDEIKLKQILVNLLSNSIKFTNAGCITLGYLEEESVVKIYVQDTGIGISESFKNDLFKTYVKGHDEGNKLGSGLGLSIIKDLTNKLGCHINYLSTEGEGSLFWFNLPYELDDCGSNYSKDTVYIKNLTLTLPRASTLLQEPRQSPYLIDKERSPTDNLSRESFLKRTFSEKKFNKKLNVIVTDDDLIVRKGTIRTLNKTALKLSIDINIIEANDGFETLYNVYKCYSSGNYISLIISDETMNYLNGYLSAEVLTKVFMSRNLRKIPFTILTAYEHRYSERYEIASYYTKPLDIIKATAILSSLKNI